MIGDEKAERWTSAAELIASLRAEIASVMQGQALLRRQMVRVRRAALGLAEGEADTSDGIDTYEIVRRLRLEVENLRAKQ